LWVAASIEMASKKLNTSSINFLVVTGIPFSSMKKAMSAIDVAAYSNMVTFLLPKCLSVYRHVIYLLLEIVFFE
jgi:hypothetical protein